RPIISAKNAATKNQNATPISPTPLLRRICPPPARKPEPDPHCSLLGRRPDRQGHSGEERAAPHNGFAPEAPLCPRPVRAKNDRSGRPPAVLFLFFGREASPYRKAAAMKLHSGLVLSSLLSLGLLTYACANGDTVSGSTGNGGSTSSGNTGGSSSNNTGGSSNNNTGGNNNSTGNTG